MNIQTIDTSVWWIALADEFRPRDGAVVRDLIVKLQQLFQFSQVPIQLPQPGQQGFEFIEGSLRDGTAVLPIAKLTIYGDGINLVVPGDTTRVEMALEKVTEFFFSLGYREPITPPIKYYLSTIVADFKSSLDHLFPSSLLKKVSTVMPVAADAHLLTLRISFDKADLPPRIADINPTLFTIERRFGPIPLELYRYFSQANTTTEKHIELLEEAERLA